MTGLALPPRPARAPGKLPLLIWGVVLWSQPAQAGDEKREAVRVLLVETRRDALLERVAAEIAGLGFELVRRSSRAPLEQTARSEDAIAAIRVLPSRNGVEVWMADATSGRSLLRQIIIDESPGGPNHRLIALQTAELLRTSLRARPDSSALQTGSTPAPGASARDGTRAIDAGAIARPESANEVKVTTASVDESAALRSEGTRTSDSDPTAVQAALGTLFSPGGAGPSLQWGLSLQHALAANWGLLLDVSAPLVPGEVSGPEGSSRVGAWLLGSGAFSRLRSATGSSYATLGAGAALIRISASGQTHPPLVSGTDALLSVAAYARADLGFEPVHWLRFGLRGAAGILPSRVEIRFAGNQAGHWGPGFLGAFAVAEIPWR